MKKSFLIAASLLFAILPTILYAQSTPPVRNLVAHFDFEDTTNQSLQDITGNGSSGIMVNQQSQGCGVFGKSLVFNGVDDRVIFFGNIGNVFSSGDWTLAVYFKAYITGQKQGLFCKADSCRAPHFFGVRVSPLQRFVEATIRERAGKETILTGRYEKGCWHHLVVAKSQSRLTIYLDGKEVNDIPTDGVYNLTTNSPLTLGEHQCIDPVNHTTDMVRFKGEVDEMYVYNRRLSPSEIKTLYYPIDRIATRDTVIYSGGKFQAHITRTCAVQYAWNPSTTVSNSAIPNPIITPPKLYNSNDSSMYYTLKFTDLQGCSNTDSLYIKIVDPTKIGCGEVLLPKAFTPNGDNLNETFYISNPYAIEKLVSFEIYNRWGGRIWATDDKFAQWDGAIAGILSTTENFIYKIEYECAGKKQQQTGTFTLMR